MSFKEISYSVEGPMALITIDRPKKHNAISIDTLVELQQSVHDAASDEDVRVITITGSGGKAFSSGFDLSEVLDRDFEKPLNRLFRA